MCMTLVVIVQACNCQRRHDNMYGYMYAHTTTVSSFTIIEEQGNEKKPTDAVKPNTLTPFIFNIFHMTVKLKSLNFNNKNYL